MARSKKLTPEKPQFSIHSVTLTTEEVGALEQLSRDASDFLGRSISSSAVIRALLRQVVKGQWGVAVHKTGLRMP